MKTKTLHQSKREAPAKRSGAFNTIVPIYYALTIKKTGSRLPNSEETIQYLIRLEQKGLTIEDGHFELDSDRRLHWHGTVTAAPNLFYKKFVEKGWHTHFEIIPSMQDLISWTHYIEEDYINPYEEELMLSENDIRVSPYPFIMNNTYNMQGMRV